MCVLWVSTTQIRPQFLIISCMKNLKFDWKVTFAWTLKNGKLLAKTLPVCIFHKDSSCFVCFHVGSDVLHENFFKTHAQHISHTVHIKSKKSFSLSKIWVKIDFFVFKCEIRSFSPIIPCFMYETLIMRLVSYFAGDSWKSKCLLPALTLPWGIFEKTYINLLFATKEKLFFTKGTGVKKNNLCYFYCLVWRPSKLVFL